MKLYILLFIIFLVSGCSTTVPVFRKEEVCTDQSLKYLRNPRNKTKRAIHNPLLIKQMASSTRQMQGCYEQFKDRTGFDEFNTCMVVGVDEAGKLEFFNFGSKQVPLDHEFMRCARKVTGAIPYQSYGQNYILIQSYKFYVSAE